MVANFYGMIANLDENMGRLLRFLEEEGLAENTILIFMTDNGSAAGSSPRAKAAGWDGWDGGRRGSKGSPYEGGHAMPCFIRWPAGGWSGGRDIGALTAHFDLLPTFIDVMDLPELEHAPFDGTSLRPLLEGSESGWPERTLFISLGERRVVMTDRWRLVKASDKQRWELFAIRKDPRQNTNIAPGHPDTVDDLAAGWDAWYEEASKGSRERVAIILGDDRENPAVLTAHDWAAEQSPRSAFLEESTSPKRAANDLPWNQFEVRRMPYLNGTWTVDIAQDALYKITLRSAPSEANVPLSAIKARVQIGGLDLTRPIEPEWVGDFKSIFHNGVSAVEFQAHLPRGRTQLRTVLIDADGRERGAFYVTVKRRDEGQERLPGQ
jgi:hypothetical protein